MSKQELPNESLESLKAGTLGSVRRCPCCNHLSTIKTTGSIYHEFEVFNEHVYQTITPEDIYYCQNPKCSVERIYSNNVVMVSGK